MNQESNAEIPVQPTFPLEAIASYPLPGMAIPGSFAFSPDDKLITYLFSEEGSLTRQLFAFDPESGQQFKLLATADGDTEDSLSPEEKLRRERMRQREVGITSFAWSPRTGQLLIPLRGEICVKDDPSAPLRTVVGSRGFPALDPRFSPDGQHIAYVQDSELYVVPTAGGESRQLTIGARGTGRSNGLAEYVAQEEMGRRRGYWWSPDSSRLAFAEVDETHIPVYRIMHQGKDSTGEDAQEDHRYPFAGQANARVRLGVVPAAGGRPVWMDLGDNDDFYLARVNWLPDGKLTAQRLNREQSRLDLLVFDPETGQSRRLLQEKSDIWINLHSMFRPLKDGRFIWASERTGFQHLYLYDGDGKLICPLTSGDWMVDAVAGVDSKAERVYFTGSREAATECHLYCVNFDGSGLIQITADPGMHQVIVDHKKQRFVDVHHALDTAPVMTLRSLADGELIRPIYNQADPRIASLVLTPPELVSLENREGTRLYGALYRPDARHGGGPYPTIIYVYGGPHSQQVTNGWGMTVNMRAQYLRRQGYLVFVLDNRGSARRGLQFEGHIKHDMGNLEVQDQVDGVRWLAAQGLTDPERVGIYGWSYGGYMSLMCLARAADTFKVAVAGAPVTHWDGYDTCYTERYMGTPQSNPEGYRISSVMHHADKMTGKLLLIHGLIDENVHFRNSARLINAFIAARKPYDLLLFPDERHMPRKLADRIFMEEQIADYFRKHL